MTYIHRGVDFCDGLVICGKLVDLNTVANQLTHDFDLELVQLTLGNCVSFSNNRDNVHLKKKTHFIS